ncbi:MAG: glucans biosynthesis glucosyltransferase MdoH [Pseudomonadota bacterium]
MGVEAKTDLSARDGASALGVLGSGLSERSAVGARRAAGALRAIENDPGAMTPAGLQSRRRLAARRAALFTVAALTWAGIAAAAVAALGGDGWTVFDIAIVACIIASAPAVVLSFWTAVVGFALRRVSRDVGALVAPFWREDAKRADAAPLRSRTAVLMTIRNEDPRRALRRLIALRADLDRSSDGLLYDVFVLSDTSDPEIAAAEERLFEANRAALDGAGRAAYRRRERNSGYKAGNVREWAERWGAGYAFMAPLDADSLISADALRRLQATAERRPRIGLLQTIGLGAPSLSAFARLQQFGSRLGHRLHLTGATWWQGDCGPFWGHNALLRVDAFKRWCKLPKLNGPPPLGGAILSHDQVEASLMRRGGYEVRLVPEEMDSFEETPVTLLDFLKRETRWANGNLQYGPLLGLARLRPLSRLQLAYAIAQYIAPVAWMLLVAFAAAKLVEPHWMVLSAPGAAPHDPTLGIALFFGMIAATLAPKLLGALDLAMTPGAVRRHGGARRFAVSIALETVYSVLLAPIVAFRLTIFVLGLPFGKKFDWGGQRRDAYRLTWGDAARALWPQTAAGFGLAFLMLATMPGVIIWATPLLLGLCLAIPFAVLTADPAVGRWMARHAIAAAPEEGAPPPILRAVEEAALRERAAPPRRADAAGAPAAAAE